jgi:NAD(P)-dependent dehydrogenase (short-subunit alcohol dehydrogenase family)
MVSLKIVEQSNARVASLPQGLVALFIGATSGIGQSTLQNFAHHAPSPRIYTVARPSAVASHETFLGSLRQSNPDGTYKLITADTSLVSEVDKVVEAVMRDETKLDILFLSAGFMAFEGRKDTSEGLDPSMSTRYYSRLRAVEGLLPLLNSSAAPSPRVVSVLAGGLEGPLRANDLDLRAPGAWSFWTSSVHAGTMGTLALERLAREYPRLGVVHWFPGPVDTPALARAQRFGMSGPQNPMSYQESGARGLFLATSDRFAGQEGGLVPPPEGLPPAKKSGGGIFLVDPLGDSANSENVLAPMRQRGVDKTVWEHTQKVFEACSSRAGGSKDEL